MANNDKNRADSTGNVICNPESAFLRLSDLLQCLERQRVTIQTFRNRAGLFADHPQRFHRERWEITAGKMMLLDALILEVLALPREAAPENLMGEKPSTLPAEDADALASVIHSLMDAADWYSSTLETRRVYDAAVETAKRGIDIITRLSRFSGSAEEQPEPREESLQPIGKPPVTVAGANPPPEFSYLVTMPGPALAALSEAVLDELESRGAAPRWAAV